MEEGVYLLNGFEGLSTTWYIEIFETVPKEDEERHRAYLKDTITSFEEKYSRFKETSILSVLNSSKKVAFDKGLSEMISLANNASHASGGIFDIFIEDDLVKKGYGKRIESTTKESHEDSFVEVTDQEIVLHGNKRIDLGGVGKGYLIDQLVRCLRDEMGYTFFLINGGGDMYVTSNQGRPVDLFLQHPIKKEEYVGKISIQDKSFCASSSYTRAWSIDGSKKNHFVTKDGGEIWAASYVVAPSTSHGDMLATILCLLSKDKEACATLANVFSSEFLVMDEKQELFGGIESLELF